METFNLLTHYELNTKSFVFYKQFTFTFKHFQQEIVFTRDIHETHCLRKMHVKTVCVICALIAQHTS